MSTRDLFVLAIALSIGLGLICWGISMWSIPAALVACGCGVGALGFLFVARVPD